mgnify:CR=1 FL=1
MSPNTLPLNTGDVGAARELLVYIDLMERGYQVFRAVSQASPVDLIRDKDGLLERVEVTSGHIHNNGSLTWAPHDKAKFDILAVVLPTNRIVYINSSDLSKPGALKATMKQGFLK